MKKQLIVTGLLFTAALGGVGVASTFAAQDPPPGMEGMHEVPGLQKEHKWLEQLVGEWTVESQMQAGPPDAGIPAMKATGTDTVRSLGGRWILAELHSDIPGLGEVSAVLTLGYDPAKGKYIGTWVDSVTDHLWIYEGTLDSTGKILTLDTKGPNVMDPASPELVSYRDVIEIKSPDHRVLTSSAQVEGGKWEQFVTAHYHRKK